MHTQIHHQRGPALTRTLNRELNTCEFKHETADMLPAGVIGRTDRLLDDAPSA